MDWPTASLLLGTLATLLVAFLKLRTPPVPNGRIWAKAVDLVEIRTKLNTIESELLRSRQSISDLRNEFHKLTLTLARYIHGHRPAD